MTTINEPGTATVPATTIQIPAQTLKVSVTIPAQTLQIPAGTLQVNTPVDLDALAAAIVKLSAPPVVTIPPPVVTPTNDTTFWVYKDGVYSWGGDYSFAATANYSDSYGIPSGHDIAVTVTKPYGGFLPYAGGTVPQWNFDDSPYNYLVFDFKPTIDGQKAQVYFVKVGDIPVGVVVDPFNGKYGPKPVKGVWGSYKIPLTDLGVQDVSVYKFAIQDQTGLTGHIFYLNNIGFAT